MAADLFIGVNNTVGVVDQTVTSTTPTGRDVEFAITTANLATKHSRYILLQKIIAFCSMNGWPPIAGSPVYVGLNRGTGFIDQPPTVATSSQGKDGEIKVIVANAPSREAVLLALEKILLAIVSGGGASSGSGSLFISGNAPAGTQGAAFAFAYGYGGGTPGYTFSVSSGSLPAGVVLNTSTGVISGMPSGTGTSTFVIRVTDSAATPAHVDSAAQSVTIAASAPAPAPAPLGSTRARFAYGTAAADLGTMFSGATLVSSPTSDRNGTMTNTASATLYTYVFVLASAAGSGEHFFDGTGYGGFSGAGSSGAYMGADEDPTTTHVSFTDTATSNVYNVYRSAGHASSITYTFS